MKCSEKGNSLTHVELEDRSTVSLGQAINNITYLVQVLEDWEFSYPHTAKVPKLQACARMTWMLNDAPLL